jgi:hypothetical protein
VDASNTVTADFQASRNLKLLVPLVPMLSFSATASNAGCLLVSSEHDILNGRLQ